MPKNFDPVSFVKARKAQQTADAIGGDFSAFIVQVNAFITQVGVLEQLVSTLQITVNTQSETISTLQTTINNLQQSYEEHTHGYTYPDATNHTTTTHN